ncbi:MAG: hypothetical protein IPL52_15040 [Flavobacteriales bacterium]|nr:hypothetical protein [Flavobacteriales bacterium]
MFRNLNVLCFALLFSGTFAQQPCAAYLGGCYFINCKSLISYRGQDICTFADWNDPIASVGLDVYGATHKLEAQVKDGKLVLGSATRFKLKSSATEFSLTDGSTDRVICMLKMVPSTVPEASCQVNVWLDLYVSGAGYFHCDPQTSNEPFMQNMGGALFKNSKSALVLN